MKEEDSNWFSEWEHELPSPEDLIPLSQSLITPDLALAFNIPSPHQTHLSPASLLPVLSSQPNSSAEFDSPELSVVAEGGGSGSDELARTLKRPRLVWTPQLHKRFVDAVAHLGIKNAVPKTIMQLMSVDGLTRENVASHLQKYRLYLKRMQGISSNGGGGAGGPAAVLDPATDHLFASSPVPPHFLHPNRVSSDHLLRFMPVASAIFPHHHHTQVQQQFRQLGSSPPNGQLEHPFLRQPAIASQVPRISTPSGRPRAYIEDLETTTPTPTQGRKVLTLFPTGKDL